MIHTSETLQQAFHYLFPNEVPELKRLANLLPDNPVVLNIGAGAGTSGLAFMESRDDLVLITVDITKDSSPFGCLSAERQVLDEAGFLGQKRNFQIQANSRMFLDSMVDYGAKFDMIFIDADHSYAGASGDIDLSLQCIMHGGIITVHDYHKEEVYLQYEKDHVPFDLFPHPKPWPGVDLAVDTLLLGKFEHLATVDTLISFRVDIDIVRLLNFDYSGNDLLSKLIYGDPNSNNNFMGLSELIDDE